MNVVFTDTSYYIALLMKADSCHDRAVQCTKDYSGEIVTTQWVLSELGNYFSPAHLRKLYIGFLGDLTSDADITIISASGEQFLAGVKLYSERLDKSWSMVDCISFVAMREFEIVDAWTADHHFAQAGFNPVLI